jgi:hypothetical protein
MKPEDEDDSEAAVPPQVPPAEPPSEEDVWIKAPERTERIVENTDSIGNILAREIYTTWTINGIIIKEQKQVWKVAGTDVNGIGFAYEMTEDTEKIFNYYGGGPYSFYNKLESLDESSKIYTQRFTCSIEGKRVEANHILEQPSHLSSVSSLGAYHSETIKKSESYTYNSQDELIFQRNYEENRFFNESAVQTSINTTEVLISHEYYSKDQIRTTTSRYANGVFIGTESINQSGQLPGPKKVGVIKNIQSDKRTDSTENPEVNSGGGGSGDIRNETEVLWYRKYIVSQYGDDVKIHSNILSRAQLQVIAMQIRYEYLKTKCVLSLDVLPLPWLRKGMVLKINGSIYDGRCTISKPRGEAIDLNDFNFLITSMKYSRDVSGKKFTGSVTGIAFI